MRWSSENAPDVDALLQSLKQAGYPAHPLPQPAAAQHEHTECHSAAWELNLWIGVTGMVLLMVGEWVFGLGQHNWFRWTSFTVATVVQVFAGARFYRGAWNQLRAGSSNMDTLVALGSTTAYLYSAFVLFSGSGAHLYFMEAAAIISLISVGHWVEARVSAKASQSLEALFRLAPKTARRLRTAGSSILPLPNGEGRGEGGQGVQVSPLVPHFSTDVSEEQVPVEQLRVDDRIVLRPGDHVPTDAIVLEGSSALNESMLTGESMPVDKSPGTNIYAGTINLTGQLIAKVTATGEATALANIIAAVERAQTSRANIQRLGDRVSSIFVPVVVVIALLTAFFWAFLPDAARALHSWLARFLWSAHVPDGRWAASFIIPAAVLIVACPCAMGLATPAAIMAASNAASRRGILIRDGIALEKAGSVTCVLFDKTGTLTAGHPKVVASEPLESDQSVDEPISLAAALGSRSNHPLSQAVAALGKSSVQLSNVQEVRGAGIQAQLANNRVLARLGSLRWLRESGVAIDPERPFIRKWSDEGATVIALAADTRLLCLFALKDAIKADAALVVQQLRDRGLRIYLVTGDNRRTAQSIATQAGISAENVLSEVRPEDKAAVVSRFQAGGERVAFVGDGINDAPALEQSDLGVAVSKASDVAREAADIILLNSEIGAVPASLTLAQDTLRTIKQNLFWAFFYNALGIPLAALGFMSPILCAAAMGLSDIVVIGNALRLLRR